MQLTLKFGAIAASELREAASLSDGAVPQPLPGAQARIDLILESMPGIIVHISQFLPTACCEPPQPTQKQKWGRFDLMSDRRKLLVMRLQANELRATKQRERRLGERFLRVRETLASQQHQQTARYASAGQRLISAIQILRAAHVPDFITPIINGLLSGHLPVTAPCIVPLTAYTNIGLAPTQWRFTPQLKAHAALASLQCSAHACYDQIRGTVGQGLGKTFNTWSDVVMHTMCPLPSLQTVETFGATKIDCGSSCAGTLSMSVIDDCAAQASRG